MKSSSGAFAQADEFVDTQQEFHLGFLPTEQPNDLTERFGETAQKDLSEAIRLLFSVEQDMADYSETVLESGNLARLSDAVLGALKRGSRVVFGGCGASGRLSVQFEAMWRRYFLERAESGGARADLFRRRADAGGSVISGGDLAVVQSIEGFEDHESFGRQQVRESGIGPGDVFITLGEAGIAYATIGMALGAADQGAETFFFFCNPRHVMEEKLERCRRLFARTDIHFIGAPFGPMAIAGSTRMQATSLELICVGYAVETAISRWTRRSEENTDVSPNEFARKISQIVRDLSSDRSVNGIAQAGKIETETYQSNGLVTYYANRFLIDIFADTTERTPTFALPRFAPSDDPKAEQSWAFAKHTHLETATAWQDLLQRAPEGLHWSRETFQELGAPAELIRNPPDVDGDNCFRYKIGCETDPARTLRRPAIAIRLNVDGDLESGRPRQANRAPDAFDHTYTIHIGPASVSQEEGGIAVPARIVRGPLSIGAHLACKLTANTLSTVTAAALGRIRGNWMVHVLPSNKKLIDRSIRIVAHLGGHSYRDAARMLFAVLDGRTENDPWAVSPVPEVLDDLNV